jgi:hypothetical protein
VAGIIEKTPLSVDWIPVIASLLSPNKDLKMIKLKFSIEINI